MSDDLVERFRDEVRSNLGEHLGDDSVGETLQADIHAALDLIHHLRAENQRLQEFYDIESAGGAILRPDNELRCLRYEPPAYCPIHQHHKWCEHNGGVMGPTGWQSPEVTA